MISFRHYYQKCRNSDSMNCSRIPRIPAFLFLFAGLIVFLISCSDEEEPFVDPYLTEPACTSIFVPKEYTWQVVGFYPSWKHDILPIDSIQWDKITRVVYAFAYPKITGGIDFADLTNARELIEKAHAHGVEAYFSIGGGNDSWNFPEIANDPDVAERFVKSLRHYVFAYCFDGVDIDWEYWSGLYTGTVNQYESQAFVNILKGLKEDLAPYNKKISVDLYASDWGGRHYLDRIRDYADDIMIMCYDFTGSWSDPGPHSSYEDAIGTSSTAQSTGLAYWVNYRQWPKSKILLGVPFYGRDFDNNGGGISYSRIVEEYPEAPYADQVANIYYNGIETIKTKTRYVMENNYGGIMIWELGHDSRVDSISLLNAIDEEIRSFK